MLTQQSKEDEDNTTKTTNTTNTTNNNNGLSLKKVVVNYTDKQENMFAIRLYKLINKYCKINVDFNDDKFCCVDYKITSKQDTNKVMYIELKSRDKKYSNVPTFLIGYDKMVKINKHNYNNCILIWDFDIQLYFFTYDVKLISYKQKIIQNSSCIEINKCICSHGMDKLVNEIYKNLNIDINMNNPQ